MGAVITFYSYKGGVGRSMALANIGVILAKWGKKTLMIDWDLEAPGLENYFRGLLPDFTDTLGKEGLIDILHRRTVDPSCETKSINWPDYIMPVVFEQNSNLHLMTSGKKDEDYISKVRKFDFSTFYNEHDGGDFLEEMRAYWKSKYDFVLIDSRTGLTDSSGVCSIQMPDIIVLMFTATEQGFKGTLNVANKSKKAQELLIYDRLKLKALPIPTRFDNSELKLTEEWLNKFATELNAVYRDFIPIDKDKNLMIQPLDILKRTKVPYISFFGYGEKLPILEQGSDDPNSLGYVYETIAAILANDFKEIQRLKDERDGYIKTAKGEELVDYSYYKKLIEQQQEEKMKLEEQLRIKDERIQHQVEKSRMILYAIIGAVIVAALIVFFATRSGRHESSDTAAAADSTVTRMDSTKVAVDTTVKK
jgi:cellulose biosynthesis protein BcsQ